MDFFDKFKDLLLKLDLSDYGSLASIVSLLVSGLAVYLISDVRARTLFTSNVEESARVLGEVASRISELLNSFTGNEDLIDHELARADVKLRAIKRGAKGDVLSDVKRARRKIAKFRRRYRFNFCFYKPEEKIVRQVYTDISVVVDELSNVKNELLAGKKYWRRIENTHN